MKITLGRLYQLGPWLSVMLFGMALWLTHQELAEYSLHDIVMFFRQVPVQSLLLAAGFSILSYGMLVLQDMLALHNVDKKLPLNKVAFTSVISYAISNSIGHALFSGGSLRLRMYGNWGVQPAEVASVALFCAIGYFIGLTAVDLLSVLWLPNDYFVNAHWTTPLHTAVIISVLFQGIFWLLVFLRDEPLQFKGLLFPVPTPKVAFLQLVITSLDLLLAGAVLYCLLGSEITIPFALFLNAYLLAQVMGLFSQIPGGLGVFEGVFIYLLGADYPSQQLIVALLLYRIIYYFIPLMIAGAGIVAYEVRVQQWLKHPAARFSMSIINDLLPQIFSVMMLLSGTILLFSGSTPAIGERLEWLGNVIGLPMIELSNMAGSIIGLLMLILAYAIRERVGSAWYATVVLLIMGIIFSLAKGFDYEEAFILFVVLMFFLPNRKLFYRHSALLNMQLSPSWLAVIVTIVSTTIWLGFFSYKHVEYSQEMWWQFSLDDNASRFMRISLVLIVLVAVLMFQRILMAKPRPMLPTLVSQQDMDAAAVIIANSQDAQHCVALTGDKSIMWSDDRRAFIAFGVTSRFWVAVGNPCGPVDACQELIWKFREEADLFGAKVAFYQVTADDLPLYIDLGLSLVKFGEQARVDLSSFSLEGRSRAFLRQRCTKFFKEGCTFSILQTHELDNVMADLKAVSDEWIKDKNANEKGFSLGFFDEVYLKRMPVAVVKKDGIIIAFANIWHVETKEELSVDLMRYSNNSPASTMEFLFAQLMVWGRDNGYRWFNLGMAPLAGLEEHRLAPRWHRWGNALFKLGNEFYNFEGLRFYKNKFDPVWTPRYLAAPPGIATADVLLQVTRLINGVSSRSPSAKIENAE